MRIRPAWAAAPVVLTGLAGPAGGKRFLVRAGGL